ncbi:MAG: YbbR-like domain-containing protein [Phocaeicola sp.]|nr:YbbR-like domain-containing protein [Phocaeicola sp.]
MLNRKDIRSYSASLIKNIRSFLLSATSKEFLIFLFFVFIASVFWLFQVLNDNYEGQISMKLDLKNVPDNAVLTSELPSEIKVRLKDRGMVLLNYWVNSVSAIPIDFEEYEDQGNQVVVSQSALKQKIKNALSQSTELVSIYPDTLSYIYATGDGKKVPVRLKGKITVDPRYYIADVVYQPDSVMVYAPSEILDTISAAYTSSVVFEQVKDTTTQKVLLQKQKGVKFVPDFSEIRLLADVYSEKTLEVPVRGINFPANKVLRTFPSKVNVTFQVGLSHFRTVNPDDFFIAVSYEELIRGNKSKCTPHLKAFPKIIKHPRVSPEEVDFIIEEQERTEED